MADAQKGEALKCKFAGLVQIASWHIVKGLNGDFTGEPHQISPLYRYIKQWENDIIHEKILFPIGIVCANDADRK
jgi:hypothetical protein